MSSPADTGVGQCLAGGGHAVLDEIVAPFAPGCMPAPMIAISLAMVVTPFAGLAAAASGRHFQVTLMSSSVSCRSFQHQFHRHAHPEVGHRDTATTCPSTVHLFPLQLHRRDRVGLEGVRRDKRVPVVCSRRWCNSRYGRSAQLHLAKIGAVAAGITAILFLGGKNRYRSRCTGCRSGGLVCHGVPASMAGARGLSLM